MTEEIARIKNAQLKWTQDMIADALKHGYSDDGYDYLRGALALSQELLAIDYDGDESAYQSLMATGLGDFACDGICPEIYDLKPASLESED